MRIVMFTGKGGVGKTTTAAATAIALAERGVKTLLLSTDAAHSVADVLGVDLDGEPREVAGALWAVQIDTQQRFEALWQDVQAYLVKLMSRSGLDPVTAQELTILPGIEEVLALLEVREFARAGHWDAVVVDCAPTAETLRLLALPEALDWYLAKVLPAHRRLARGARPIAALFGRAEAMPTDAVFAALLRLRDDLAATRTLLADPQITTVRLVLTPEAVVVAEARRTFTALALYGYRVDLVVANRVFPPGRDAFRQAWVSAQREQLSQLRDSFAGLPVAQVAYGSAEPIGLAALGDIARALYAGSDPADSGAAARPMAVEADGAGYRLRLWLPLAHKSDIDAARVGDDLVLTVAGYRRVLSLPSVLRRCEVVGARFEQLSSGADRAAADRPPGGELIVQFLPDPNLWPRSTETDRSAMAGRDALPQEETRA